MKITDPEYTLPLIHALNYRRLLGSGTTEPILLLGVDETTGQRGDFVAKLSNGPRMTANACCRELICAWIGHELSFNTVEPVVVNISVDFVDTMAGAQGWRNAANSVGLNFGCKYVPGYMEFVRNQKLNDIQAATAQHIFALDLFIANPDRRVDKPNMPTNGQDILIFDHELAFSFVMDLPFMRNKTPWQLRSTDREWIENHYFYSYLKRTQIDFSAFVEKFSALDAQFWTRLKQLLPPIWLNEQVDIIQEYLTSIVNHRAEFSAQLTQVLLQ